MSIEPFSFNVSLSKASSPIEHKEEEKIKDFLRNFITIFESYLTDTQLKDKSLEITLTNEDSKFTSEYIEKKLEKFENIPEDFNCPLYLQLMKDPVILPSNYTCEKEAIKMWLLEHNTDPFNRAFLKYENVFLNSTISSDIESFKIKRLNKIITLASQCYKQNFFEQANQAIRQGKFFAEKIKDKKNKQTFLHLFKLIENSINFSSEQISKDDSSKLTILKNEALYNLGICYIEGYGVEKNEDKAIQCFDLAAKQNYAPAQMSLGICLYRGYGGKKDIKKAFEFFELAAKQNYAIAQYNLGNCFYHGRGTKQNYENAFNNFELAAKQDYAPAQYALARCHLYGKGVEIDFKKAFKYFKLAAMQKHADAQYNLGACFFYAEGVEQDYEKAFKWFKSAAKQKHADAQFYLGTCYLNGYGTEKNSKKADKYFKLAADQGVSKPQIDISLRIHILVNKVINFFRPNFFN